MGHHFPKEILIPFTDESLRPGLWKFVLSHVEYYSLKPGEKPALAGPKSTENVNVNMLMNNTGFVFSSELTLCA